MAEAATWGREVVRSGPGDQAPLIYRDRHRHLADLLADSYRWADRDFLVQGTRRLTFADFHRCVAVAAAQLRSAGVGRGDRVMVLAANSPEWVIAFFATFTLDAAVVSGNAWWSEAEIAHACRTADPRLVVADARRAERLPPGTPRLSLTELGRSTTGAAVEAAPGAARSGEEDPAVILFTSGTTGAPKAATLSHRSVIANQQNLLVATRRLPPDLPPDHRGTVTLLSIPIFHTGGIQTILSSLLTGGTLVFLVAGFDAAEALQIIETERVRVWGGVPTMMSRILDHPDLERRDTSSVLTVTIAGTTVPAILFERVRDAFPSARRSIGTIYGMTESGGTLTAVTGPEMEQRPGTVGRALPTVELRIGDPNEAGIGEVQALAPTVMCGYWGSDEHPFTPDGWLRTGDLGRLDGAGYLYLEGRSKDIIIRGGENIACPHVENVIAGHPAVAEVAVIGLPDDDFGEIVGAVVVIRPDHRIEATDLEKLARDRLAHFEVPQRWWLRREPLPTNATGKVVKSDLRTAWMQIRFEERQLP
jgi:long-chain acyl-CoA synthetase